MLQFNEFNRKTKKLITGVNQMNALTFYNDTMHALVPIACSGIDLPLQPYQIVYSLVSSSSSSLMTLNEDYHTNPYRSSRRRGYQCQR